jgi:sec-independent protein translocase protein TatA
MRDWMIPALLILILVVFGSKRLPGMAQSLGQSLRILRRESASNGDHDADDGPPAAAPGVPPTPAAKPVVPPAHDTVYIAPALPAAVEPVQANLRRRASSPGAEPHELPER